MKKVIMFVCTIMVMFLMIGCVTYKASSGYVVSNSGKKTEFKDARIGWDSTGSGFEIWEKDTHFYMPGRDISEIHFEVKK